MKKTLLAALVLANLTQAKAQQGSILSGGSIGISTAKSPSTPNNNKQSSFSFQPTLGYQFTDNWTAGAVAGIQNSKYSNSNNVVDENSTFAIGPFVRYTKSLSDIFYVFGQLQGNFGSSKFNGIKAGSFTSVSAFPAVFINVKNGFGLNFDFGGISYNSINPSAPGSTTTAFSLTFGQTANLGISKNFSFKKK